MKDILVFLDMYHGKIKSYLRYTGITYKYHGIYCNRIVPWYYDVMSSVNHGSTLLLVYDFMISSLKKKKNGKNREKRK